MTKACSTGTTSGSPKQTSNHPKDFGKKHCGQWLHLLTLHLIIPAQIPEVLLWYLSVSVHMKHCSWQMPNVLTHWPKWLSLLRHYKIEKVNNLWFDRPHQDDTLTPKCQNRKEDSTLKYVFPLTVSWTHPTPSCELLWWNLISLFAHPLE